MVFIYNKRRDEEWIGSESRYYGRKDYNKAKK